MTKAPDIYAAIVRPGLSFPDPWHLLKTDSHRFTWSDLMARYPQDKKREVGQSANERSCRDFLGGFEYSGSHSVPR